MHEPGAMSPHTGEKGNPHTCRLHTFHSGVWDRFPRHVLFDPQHEASFLFPSIDVECLQTKNYPSMNCPRKSKARWMCLLWMGGGNGTGGWEGKLLSSRCASRAIVKVDLLCVFPFVRLLRVSKEDIHTGVQAPQKAPAAVGPRPFSDEGL